MAIKYPYDPSQLTENETLYEELIKIRRYLDKNPIYKIYNSTEEASKLIGIYELDLVDVPEGTELTKDDVVLFANSMFAVVTSIDLETRTFTVKDVQSIKGPKGDKGDTGAQGPEGPKGEPGGVPVADFNELKRSVAENVKGIAHLNEIKQDKLAQVDLDNIASINQMKEDIKGKQDKLTQAQLQAIGEIDAIKGIALDNQSNKASKTEVNSLSMCPSESFSKFTDIIGDIDKNAEKTFVVDTNGYVQIIITSYFPAKSANDKISIGVETLKDYVLYKFYFLPIFASQTESFFIPVKANDKIYIYNSSTNIYNINECKLFHTKEI